jgi:tetratricopeptide (TPR) repeat protein
MGIANALRLLDRSQEALAQLEEAEREGSDGLDHADRARIHYLRGSLFFPLAEEQAGLAEQTRALEHARLAGSIELQLRALSGLGDAHYAGGRLVSAYDRFRECVELSRLHRVVQVEAANLPMLAISHYFMGRMGEGLQIAEAALALAKRVANPRSELIANHAICIMSLAAAEVERALRHARISVDIARATGARRFVPEGLLFIGRCMGQQGNRREARAIMLEALELAREHISYFGPWVLGALAAHAENDRERRGWLHEGEGLLKDGSPAHNYIGFYSEAIDASLEAGCWDEALGYCDRLDHYFQREPAPLPSFIAARGRVQAAIGSGARNRVLRAELLGLIEQGKRSQLTVSVASLEAAARQAGWLPAAA